MSANWNYEQKFWAQGKLAAGLDEVGRGAFAGPVVAAAVIFPADIKIEVEIDDSKKLTPRKREVADKWIRQNSSFAIGSGSVNEINKIGIVGAANRAFRRSVAALGEENFDHLLIDAFYIPYIRGFAQNKQTAIIKGDSKSVSIAAASIVAKVYRDKQMVRLSRQANFRAYKWEQNKGYGTSAHRQALVDSGHTKHHRLSFIKATLAHASS